MVMLLLLLLLQFQLVAADSQSGNVADGHGECAQAADVFMHFYDNVQATRNNDGCVFDFPSVSAGKWTVTAHALPLSRWTLSLITNSPVYTFGADTPQEAAIRVTLSSNGSAELACGATTILNADDSEFNGSDNSSIQITKYNILSGTGSNRCFSTEPAHNPVTHAKRWGFPGHLGAWVNVKKEGKKVTIDAGGEVAFLDLNLGELLLHRPACSCGIRLLTSTANELLYSMYQHVAPYWRAKQIYSNVACGTLRHMYRAMGISSQRISSDAQDDKAARRQCVYRLMLDAGVEVYIDVFEPDVVRYELSSRLDDEANGPVKISVTQRPSQVTASCCEERPVIVSPGAAPFAEIKCCGVAKFACFSQNSEDLRKNNTNNLGYCSFIASDEATSPAARIQGRQRRGLHEPQAARSKTYRAHGNIMDFIFIPSTPTTDALITRKGVDGAVLVSDEASVVLAPVSCIGVGISKVVGRVGSNQSGSLQPLGIAMQFGGVLLPKSLTRVAAGPLNCNSRTLNDFLRQSGAMPRNK